MPKRKTPDPATDSPTEEEKEEVDTTAEDLMTKQKNQQMKRRFMTRVPGSRAETSLWTTIAATRLESEKPQFMCNVCSNTTSSNQAISSSNIKLHFQ